MIVDKLAMEDSILDIDFPHIVEPAFFMSPVKWMGGKAKHFKRILPLLADNKIYCEPFCGAASVFLNRTPAPVEVINDYDGAIINFFKVMQCADTYEDLKRRILWTPFAHSEFKSGLRILRKPSEHTSVERAWAFYVVYNMGFQAPKNDGNWARSQTSSGKGMGIDISTWRSRLGAFTHWHNRLTSAYIEDGKDGIEVIKYWDSPDTTFYCDPPYHSDTRRHGEYSSESGQSAATLNERLVDALLEIKGSAVLSCYDHACYAPLVSAGWERQDFDVVCHAAAHIRTGSLQGVGASTTKQKRTEVLYIKNDRGRQLTMFDMGAL